MYTYIYIYIYIYTHTQIFLFSRNNVVLRYYRDNDWILLLSDSVVMFLHSMIASINPKSIKMKLCPFFNYYIIF